MSTPAVAKECDLPEAHDPHPWEGEFDAAHVGWLYSCSGEGTIARQARWDANVPLIGALDAMREEIRAGRHFDPSRAPMPTSLPVAPATTKTSGEQLADMGTDGAVWAKEFTYAATKLGLAQQASWTIPNFEAMALAWFANAIEAGRTAGYKQGHNEALSHEQGIRSHCPGCVWMDSDG